MKHISKLLVLIDGDYDRHAMIAEIGAITIKSGAQVTLLGITDLPLDDPENKVGLSANYEWAAGAQQKELQALRAELEQKDISVTVKQATGKPYEEAIREATLGAYDMIMKAAASDGRKLKFLFGSTDMQLFRLSPIPVCIFKPTPAKKLASVMVAVDLLSFDEEKSALADKVLRWGKYIAGVADASLHVLHVWGVYRELDLRSQVGPQSVDKLVHALEQRHRQWLDEAIAQSGIDSSKVTVHFRKGDAHEMIPLVAQAEKIDLLVMGTVGRTGIPGFFIGNIADSVLRQVDCSVLAIKPDGFRTPVKISSAGN